jgi:hypothetical protein
MTPLGSLTFESIWVLPSLSHLQNSIEKTLRDWNLLFQPRQTRERVWNYANKDEGNI